PPLGRADGCTDPPPPGRELRKRVLSAELRAYLPCAWAPARHSSTRHASVMHNEFMPLIQIRDVPESVRDELARKAAAAGQSMQAYLLAELSKLAERPTMAEIVRRAQARAAATGSTVTMDDAVAVVRAARDRRREL